jgi:hypothetical protein
MEFDLFDLYVTDLSMRNVITRCNSSGPLYTMRLPSHPAPSSPASAPSTLVALASSWHRRLSYPGVDVLSKLSHDSDVVCSRCTHDLCHAYQLGHHICLPFVSSNSGADNNFDLVHCDLWTSLVVSVSGYKYYLVILDDHFNSSLERYKARWALYGFTQRPGVDYSETFCSVVKPAMVHTVLSLAVCRSCPVHQLDVKNAFLHGTLSETVYCSHPTGFVDPA